MHTTEYRITLRSRVDSDIMDEIRRLAAKEKRTLSNMANVLLGEAIASRAAMDRGVT